MSALKIVPCQALDDATGLAAFYAGLVENGVDTFFHPHPFTMEQAESIVAFAGTDIYASLCVGDAVVGYGMLRGWDEGYEVPSLGIAIASDQQGLGFGRLLMLYLHSAARLRKSPRIRLKVYPDNLPAVGLYKSLGYIFTNEAQGQLVGFLEL